MRKGKIENCDNYRDNNISIFDFDINYKFLCNRYNKEKNKDCR